jgi:TolA-binding protein
MFKYLAGVLKQFTQSQRILALILLLFTIVSVYIGPKIVEAVTFDGTEMYAKISSQAIEIGNLNKNVDALNIQIRQNQIDCTNQIITREKEILKQISDLEKTVRAVSEEKKISSIQMLPMRVDTGMDRKNHKVYNETITIDNEPAQNTIMLKGLNKIKKDLEKSIEAK